MITRKLWGPILQLAVVLAALCLLSPSLRGQQTLSSGIAERRDNSSSERNVAPLVISQSMIAQARQGDGQTQQQFVCALNGADKHKMQEMALEQLPRIGGWYSIQFYRELLSPRALIMYRKAPIKTENRDTATKEPVWWSLISLPKVAPNPPPIAPHDSTFESAKIQQNAQIWRDWIQANEGTLKTLQPTGDGVDFSGRRCQQAFRIRTPSRQVRR